MDEQNIEIVKFHEDELIILTTHDGKKYVALRPIVESLGLNYSAQLKGVKRDPVLNSCVVIMTTQLPNDSQKREIVFLEFEMLNGWLFGIQPNRIKR